MDDGTTCFADATTEQIIAVPVISAGKTFKTEQEISISRSE
jgi:hypothetical protein